jgi:hypothetical protein
VSPPPAASPSVLARLLLVIVGTVIALLALEGGLRLVGVETASFHSIAGFTVYDPELGWRLAPGRTTVFKGPGFSVAVTHNAQGLRDRAYAYDREPGRRRILVLGDSSAWCWGVAAEECFTERLEARLPATDVINAGVPGYSTAQALLFYEREGRRYRPDLVLLLLSPNDVADNIASKGPRFRLDGGQLVLTNVPVPRRKSPLAQWLQTHSRLFAHVAYLGAVIERGMTERSLDGAPPPSPAAASEAPDRVASSLPDPVAATSAASPDRGVVRTVPEAGAQPDAATAGEAWAVTAALLERLAASVRASDATLVVVSPIDFEPMRGWVREVCAARGIAYLDLAPALWAADRPHARLRLEGDPHFAAPGHEVVAAAVLEMLERERLLAAR